MLYWLTGEWQYLKNSDLFGLCCSVGYPGMSEKQGIMSPLCWQHAKMKRGLVKNLEWDSVLCAIPYLHKCFCIQLNNSI